MKRRCYSPNRLLLFVFILVAGLLWSCGGGGGGTSTTLSGSGGTGSAAILLADGPADDYDHLWISVLEVTLLPQDGSGLNPVTLFRSSDPGGYEFDLLDLRDQDFLLTVKDNIPSGTYAKIRLEINPDSIDAVVKEGVVAPCDDIEIKLPSGKIDLNPRGGIPVRAGDTLVIRLDIDANKSIQLHSAGSSGKCIFRPVVFVEIEPVFVPDRCPRIISGTIGNIYTNAAETTIGFELRFANDGRDPMDVWLIDTVIFDDDLTVGDSGDLVSGRMVHVRGRLDAEGDLQASMVVIGMMDRAKGTVATTVVDDTFQIADYILYPEPDPSPSTVNLAVELVDGAAIYSGCDTPVNPGFIQEGMGSRMIGQWNAGTNTFQAVAVFLTPQMIAGTISDYDTDSRTLTLDPPGTTVSIPDGIYPYLVGDGQVPWVYLRNRTDCGQGVSARVYVDPEIIAQTAVKILIPPERFPDAEDAKTIAVTDVYPIAGIIEVEGGHQISVENGATILLRDGDSDAPVSLGDLSKMRDIAIESYGLYPCSSSVGPDFFAFIVIVSPLNSE